MGVSNKDHLFAKVIVTLAAVTFIVFVALYYKPSP